MVTGAHTTDVVVLGAGAAGLAAAHRLAGAGLRLVVVEARDRVGGRVHTLRPSGAGMPIELGAEFVHGRPAETFAIAQAAGLTVYELSGKAHAAPGGSRPPAGIDGAKDDDAEDDESGDMDDILAAIEDYRGPDISYERFVAERFAGERWAGARKGASRYIQGFDAADPAEVSVAWLARSDAASDAVEGERQHRIADGYDGVMTWLRDGLDPARVALRLGTVATAIRWEPGRVEVSLRSALGTPLAPVVARAAVITLPLGVLAASLAPRDGGRGNDTGLVRFDPEPPQVRALLSAAAMGDVSRVILRFDAPFWDEPGGGADAETPRFPQLSFLFGDDPDVPTWWTSYPLYRPLLTGWTGGPRSRQLLSLPDDEVAGRAVASLGRLLGMPRPALEARLVGWYLHNWARDPFARGAYSYVRVGGLPALDTLAAPIAGTLAFAGEATDTLGHTGTVHGALITGYRAADALLAVFGASRGA